MHIELITSIIILNHCHVFIYCCRLRLISLQSKKRFLQFLFTSHLLPTASVLLAYKFPLWWYNRKFECVPLGESDTLPSPSYFALAIQNRNNNSNLSRRIFLLLLLIIYAFTTFFVFNFFSSSQLLLLLSSLYKSRVII